MALIRRSEFSQPTPIQAQVSSCLRSVLYVSAAPSAGRCSSLCTYSSQAIPAALRGRDVIGMAKTGSGKTVAYLWPLLVHCMDQVREERSRA